MTVTCEDWRQVPASVIAPLLDAEYIRWETNLGWDIRPSWAVVEPSRASGRLPGFIARDERGQVRGWTCFLANRDSLQVAALVADAPAVTSALVDAVVASDDGAATLTQDIFTLDEAPGLRDALGGRGFALETYRYLRAGVSRVTGAERGWRPWRLGDLTPVIRLCERAYRDSTEIRPFAPNGREDEWVEYITQLVAGPGCGQFLPEASVVATDGAGSHVCGAVITTRLDRSTAHLAQVIVDPLSRGHGVGRGLVRAAVVLAGQLGFAQVTLLVAAGNTAGAQLYAGLGFRDAASFVAGVKRQPCRLTNAAHATGGASTLR